MTRLQQYFKNTNRHCKNVQLFKMGKRECNRLPSNKRAALYEECSTEAKLLFTIRQKVAKVNGRSSSEKLGHIRRWPQGPSTSQICYGVKSGQYKLEIKAISMLNHFWLQQRESEFVL